MWQPRTKHQPWRPAVFNERDPRKAYVTTPLAAATDRCVCEGCPACRGRKDYPCGGLAYTGKCRFCLA